ncbi:Predicted arabinose efflux permease, MFS family [Paenibacillus tianmuensis]|uniref:Predicted arabinose efflux permease, MFS family n=1 Tax=Paenibacillus tianmuensis TaxID=624147 RepID=A0A1G4RKH6_9BACL|nr:MFS transporter [Paenibacillus tianmuensis]SCW57318.1 Predicted arabinose efflux permease, MFS family [Paenibacillus tianmuensis]
MNRSFYALLVSQTATNLGFALYTMVVVMHLYTQTGSTALSAAVTLISAISRMVSGVVLPSFADRFRLPILLILSQTAQLVVLLCLALMLTQDVSASSLIVIMVLLAIISFFNGWFSPVKSSLLRAVVPEKERVRAIGLLSTVDQTFQFAGWTLGGVLLTVLGQGATLGITFALLVVSIGCIFLLKQHETTELRTGQGFVSGLTAGWKILYRHEGLRVLVMMDLIESWVGTIWIGAVTLTFVKEALHEGEAWWGYINGGYYLGTIVGGLNVLRLSRRMQGKLTMSMLTGASLFGVLTLLYGFVSNSMLALLLVLLMGPAYQIRDLVQESMIQNSSDEHTLLKVAAARSTLVQLISMLSIAVIGIVTDVIGVRLVYIVSGCVLLVSSVYGFVQLQLRKKGALLEREHL